ncbi:hypothetical protein G6L37_07505 [Agrobacterium rubi]|nr:hypothetical protein [Agrobacterium rubi]NTF25214.1 hypothetical protein [Agrobacterium rubi]
MLDVVNYPHLKDPRIGVLMREGRQIFYAHIDGEFPERDTADEILVLLGVPSEPPQTSENPSVDFDRVSWNSDPADLYVRSKPGEDKDWRNFTIKIVNLDIPWQAPGYFVVKAPNKRAAVGRAREEMRSTAYDHTRRDGRLDFSVVEDR